MGTVFERARNFKTFSQPAWQDRSDILQRFGIEPLNRKSKKTGDYLVQCEGQRYCIVPGADDRTIFAAILTITHSSSRICWDVIGEAPEPGKISARQLYDAMVRAAVAAVGGASDVSLVTADAAELEHLRPGAWGPERCPFENIGVLLRSKNQPLEVQDDYRIVHPPCCCWHCAECRARRKREAFTHFRNIFLETPVALVHVAKRDWRKWQKAFSRIWNAINLPEHLRKRRRPDGKLETNKERWERLDTDEREDLEAWKLAGPNNLRIGEKGRYAVFTDLTVDLLTGEQKDLMLPDGKTVGETLVKLQSWTDGDFKPIKNPVRELLRLLQNLIVFVKETPMKATPGWRIPRKEPTGNFESLGTVAATPQKVQYVAAEHDIYCCLLNPGDFAGNVQTVLGLTPDTTTADGAKRWNDFLAAVDFEPKKQKLSTTDEDKEKKCPEHEDIDLYAVAETAEGPIYRHSG